MPAPDLAALEHENLIEAIALAAVCMPGSLVRRDHGVALIHSGAAIRLFNQVILESEAPDPVAISDAVAVMRERGAHFVVNLRRGTDDRSIPLVASLGLELASPDPWMPGMAMHPIPSQPPVGGDSPGGTGQGLRIEAVDDQDGLEVHVRVLAEGFEMPLEVIRPVLGPAILERPDVTFYVGLEDGRPVTSGMSVRTGRTVGVYSIATLPDARRRGHGAAMTARVVQDGVRAGCEVAALQASDMGAPIYQRMGFRTVVEYSGYIDPEGPASA